MSIFSISFLNHLDDFIKIHDIDKGDFCIVGSSALAMKGLRANSDIDICVTEELLSKKFSHLTKTTKIDDKIELLLSKKYEKYFGVSDDEIIHDPRYHEIIGGYKVIKTELEFAAKLVMRRPKDKNDIKLILNYAEGSATWDWTLVFDKKFNGELLPSKYTRLLKHLKNPINLTKKILNKSSRSLAWRRKKLYNSITAISDKLLFSTDVINDAVIKYPVNKILSKQFIGDGQFNRLDIIIRLLAVENLYGKNSFGFDFYTKMQVARKAEDGFINRFTALIKSIEENRFNDKFPVEIDSRGNIYDGAHRLSLACYHRLDVVSVKIAKPRFSTDYTREWLGKYGFTNEELDVVNKKKIELFYDYGIYFPVMLWPAAKNNYTNIVNDVRQEFHVVNEQDILFNSNERFNRFCRDIYSIDDIEAWKIERKIAFMASYQKCVKVLWLEVPYPLYRKKKSTNNDISQRMEILKKKIRAKYKGKISNYVHDIIIHTGDNFEHNKRINALILNHEK